MSISFKKDDGGITRERILSPRHFTKMLEKTKNTIDKPRGLFGILVLLVSLITGCGELFGITLSFFWYCLVGLIFFFYGYVYITDKG